MTYITREDVTMIHKDNTSCNIRLGAIDKKTLKYVSPNIALKINDYMCPDCKCNVILRQGCIRPKHFAHHKSSKSCMYYTHPTESQIHKDAKYLMKMIIEMGIPLTFTFNCQKCKNNETLLHPIHPRDALVYLEYKFEYNGSKIADVAVVNNNKPVCIYEIYNTHKTKETNRPDPWFEIDANDLLAKVIDNQPLQLECIRERYCSKCRNEGTDEELTTNKEGIIYFNQRGAGCGKTYESIQLIQSDDRFAHKDVFIYLTKMHSAKDVIYNELYEQIERNALDKLEILEHDNGVAKQYKVLFKNKHTGRDISIIIGTIDSFNYAVVNKNKIESSNDFFKGIVNTIKGGEIVSGGNIKYASKAYNLNEKCLIVIDEAQDLGKDYIEAFSTIINKTKIDVYVIGDKLQSIWGNNNIYTYVEKNDLSTHIQKSHGVNHVMRFHNTNFINLVNSVIDFQKYNLPPIEKICEGKCKYKHEDEIIPYKVFSMMRIYSGVDQIDIINKELDKIIEYMDYEVNKYDYLPHNFMFIFPMFSGNSFANFLEIHIQRYWIAKFTNEQYQQRVLINHPYWKNKMDSNKFHKYVYLHKSEEGKPINLRESEYASRILSIHASKGNGCEVVFLLGLSEGALRVFSKNHKESDIVYDSLLHVAITRQKKSLYLGIEDNNDDIWKRFKKVVHIQEDLNNEPNISNITRFKNYNKFYSNITDDTFNKINENFILPQRLAELIPDENEDKLLIDWGHHLIRFAVMRYNIMYKIESDKKDKTGSQFIASIRWFSENSITTCDYKKYRLELNKINNNIRHSKYEDNNTIPILTFDSNPSSDYYKYSSKLGIIIRHIQNKIKNKLKKDTLPKLCPLESIILLFVLDLLKKGVYSDISIMDIYSLMYCYNECSQSMPSNHDKEYTCLCKESFDNDFDTLSSHKEIRKSITDHYNNLLYVDTIYDNYKKYIKDNLADPNDFCYNITHNVWFKKYNSENFGIRDNFTVIAHSEKYVIYFLIKPQFNGVNFNSVITEAIYDNFMLKNCETNKRKIDNRPDNFDRYNGKEIITCIITFDSLQPVFYRIKVDDNDDIMREVVKDQLYNLYSEHHEQMYKFYRYCCHNKPNNISSVEYTCNKLDETYIKNGTNVKKYRNLPEYIRHYFTNTHNEMQKASSMVKKRDIVISKLGDEKVFLDNISNSLNDAIDVFIGYKKENGIIFDF